MQRSETQTTMARQSGNSGNTPLDRLAAAVDRLEQAVRLAKETGSELAALKSRHVAMRGKVGQALRAVDMLLGDLDLRETVREDA